MDGRRSRRQAKALSGLRGDPARGYRGPDRVGGDRGGLHQGQATHQLERTTQVSQIAKAGRLVLAVKHKDRRTFQAKNARYTAPNGVL